MSKYYKYDIIIPCYNSHKTIERTLASILMQNNIEEIKITLVNDAGKDYSDTVRFFSKRLNIKEITYENNRGPGFARNYGRLNTNCKYLMFIDSDDCLAHSAAVETLGNYLDNNPKDMIIISNFIEERQDKTLKIRLKDTTFTHGKMYRRSYLEKYNILANDQSYCCEDMSFNLLALLLLNQKTEIAEFVDYISYYWLCNENSIGRTNRETYQHSVVVRGFIENLIWLFKQLKIRNVDNEKIFHEKIVSMQRACLMYSEHVISYPQFEEGNRLILKKFYENVYKEIEDKVTDDLFEELAKEVFTFEDAKTGIPALKTIINLLKCS